jgi:oxepin-CoA hydrolase/3-oxo-5,6-dehydrosuberyl-CoA semialdehyde dehydrogenase
VVSGEGRPVATYDVLTMVAKTWPPTEQSAS